MTDQDIREKVSAIERDLEAVKLCLEDKAEQEANGALVQIDDYDADLWNALRYETGHPLIGDSSRAPVCGLAFLNADATAALGTFQPVPDRAINAGDCIRVYDSVEITTGPLPYAGDKVSLVAKEDPAYRKATERRTTYDEPGEDHNRKLNRQVNAALAKVADVAKPPAPQAKEQGGCECPPCPGRGNDGHGLTHCAECCFGTGVEAELDCPVHGEPDPAPPVIKEPEPAQCDAVHPGTRGRCKLSSGHDDVHDLEPDTAPSDRQVAPSLGATIPEAWDLITAGDGRTYEAVTSNTGYRWRLVSADASARCYTDAEILALGPVRRAVVITLPDVEDEQAHKIIESSRGGPWWILGPQVAAEHLLAAALHAEEGEK